MKTILQGIYNNAIRWGINAVICSLCFVLIFDHQRNWFLQNDKASGPKGDGKKDKNAELDENAEEDVTLAKKA
jgi:hypothetical protein